LRNAKKISDMKKLLLVVLAMSSILTSCGQKQFSDETLKMNLTSTDNKEVVFADIINKYKGKTVVMEVWASWCGDCVKAMPKLKELQANNPDVVYLFVSMDKKYDKWLEGIEKHQLKGDHFWANDPEMMKGKFGKSIDLDWIPRYMIIDKNQQIVTYRAIETDFDKLNATLKTLK
jgi:thiol-disulfide isomerase/thioredoxin